jgi:periplasmic protein TonB
MSNYTEFVFDESDQQQQPAPAGEGGVGGAPRRPRYRPPVGIPEPVKQSWWQGSVASVVLHALILLLVLAPIFAQDVVNELLEQGAGGPGPAGGGGGGRGGTGGETAQERLQYIQVAPPPPAPTPAAEVPPIVPPPKEEVAPIAPKIDIKTDVPTTDKIDLALTAGIGGGTGRDGSSGTGPGSGGGVGSGVGTGRGSSVGPGTGGGEGTIYPPTPIQVFIPPMPAPERIKPYTLVAMFEVDERGNVISVKFNPSRDGNYNRRLKEVLNEVRFRPATRWDGTPVRALTKIEFLF